MAFLTLKMTIYLVQNAQIALLLIEKVTVSEKYLDFADVFSKKSAKVLPKRMGINKHVIKIEKEKQQSYGFIYCLGLVELEILKTYIETNLINGFIWPSKSSTKAPIIFV